MVLLVVVEVFETSSSHYRWEALPISYTTVYHNPERKKRIELLVRILSSSALQAAPFPLGTLSLLLYHLFLVKDFFLGIAEGTRTPMYPLAFS